MKKILSTLQGKKSYLVVIVAIIFNTLVQYGYVDPSFAQYINAILAALGLGALRSAVNKV